MVVSSVQDITRALLRCHAPPLFYIILVFCLLKVAFVKADSMIDSLKLSLSTEDGLSCVRKGQNVTLKCTLRYEMNVNKSNRLDVQWGSEGGELIERNSSRVVKNIVKNTTIFTSILTVYVTWETEKVFICFAEYYEDGLSRNPVVNASLTLGTMPQQTNVHGVRFIEGIGEKVLEIYWKQNEGFNYTYSVTYTIEDDDIYGNKEHIINDILCYKQVNDVYRVPHMTGMVCKGSLREEVFQDLSMYRVHVNTINGQCRSTGAIRKFELLCFAEEDPGPDKDSIVLIPLSVNRIEVNVTKQQVRLTWQNPKDLMKYRWYRLTYNCSDVAARGKKIDGNTYISLYRNDMDFPNYKPYSLCTFCIQTYLQTSSVPSSPFCRKARLHEEKPSTPPRITCAGDECATTYDERFRNVTITWSLPPRETWNGVLTHVVVICSSMGNGSRNSRSIPEPNVTRGFTMLPMLARNTDYVVNTAVCNKEGCSHYGNASVFGAKVAPEQANKSMSVKSGDKVALAVSVGIASFLAVIIIVVVIVCCVRKRSKDHMNSHNSLPTLTEPKSQDYDNVSGIPADKEYQDLARDDGNQNVGLDGSSDSQETNL